MRGKSEKADQSGTDLGISHVVKRFRNALEVKAHAAQGMPKMSLQEKESKVEAVSYTHLTLPTIYSV